MLPSWVTEAAALPVAFAQVREDALLDAWVVDQVPGDARVILVASGGCTASLLATVPKVVRLHLVDSSPAQLALSRLKLRLLETCAPEERRALIGRSPLPSAVRRERLVAELGSLGYSPDVLGPPALVADVGPDHVGRYERVFAALRAQLADQAAAIDSLIGLNDLPEQARRFAQDSPLGRRVDAALDEVMSFANLARLFGNDATANSAEPFASHFARRLRHVFAMLPAARNPYLHQMLAGRDPPGSTAPWLSAPMQAPMPRITWSNSSMTDALAAAPATFDFVHLSNILDWLSPSDARETLDLAWRALRAGGWVFVRQLNSTLDVKALPPRFEWRSADANALLARDRSFFYRELHLGRKA